MIERSVKVRNYKCFGDEEQGFERILPINIIIGKNNSGKSSLIDLIQYLFEPQSDLLQTKSSRAKCVIGAFISDQLIGRVGKSYAKNQSSSEGNWIELVKQHVHSHISKKEVTYDLLPGIEIQFFDDSNEFGQYRVSFIDVFQEYTKGKKFRRISAERDITPERFYGKEGLSNSGKNATNLIWKYLNFKGFNQNIIKKDFLRALNIVVNPDIEFADIMIQEDNLEHKEVSEGEIYFEYSNGQWIPLSKMGSGLKTIILVILNLIVIPYEIGCEKGNLVFGFEELENNLHPSLQRRLFDFIVQYSTTNGSYFFITTHSSLAIDVFSLNENAQFIHVQNRNGRSIAQTVNTQSQGKLILKDLDFRPSDLLMSNGVIWVEGPSDVIYLELLLSLLLKVKNEKFGRFSYTIQALSTAIWKYAGFNDFDWEAINNQLENQIVSLAKVNLNHLIIIDKDDNYEDKKPSEFDQFSKKIGSIKARLIYESIKYNGFDENELKNNFGDSKSGTLFFWVNDGSVETYLEYFIMNKGREFAKHFSFNETKGYFEKKNGGISKVELASLIANFAFRNNLEFEDFGVTGSLLEAKILRLIETIKSWN